MASYKIPESVLVVIHTADLSVLLLERADKAGFWQSVTGSKETPEEKLADTAAREVQEETGIVIVPTRNTFIETGLDLQTVFDTNLHNWQVSNAYEIYPVWRHRYAPGVMHNVEHVFSLQVPPDIRVTLCLREHLRYLWLPWQTAAERCFSPSNAQAILQLPDRCGLKP